MSKVNQTPEQKARDNIDAMLGLAGWLVQDKKKIDFGAGFGIAIREYQTDVGPADYVLFIDKNPVGVIEAKPEDWGQKITTVEEQSAGYATARALLHDSTAARVGALFQLLVQDTTAQDFGLPSSAIRLRM